MKFVKCSERLPEIGKKVIFKDNHGIQFSGKLSLYSSISPNNKKQEFANFYAVESEIYKPFILLDDIESWAELPEGKEREPLTQYIK